MSSILAQTVTCMVYTQQVSSFHLGRDTGNYDSSACYILLLPPRQMSKYYRKLGHKYFSISSQLGHKYFSISSPLGHKYSSITSQLGHKYSSISSQFISHYNLIVWLLIAEAQVKCQGSPCGICGDKVSLGQTFS